MSDGTAGDDRDWDVPRRESDVYPSLEMSPAPTPAGDAGPAAGSHQPTGEPVSTATSNEAPSGAPDDEEMPLADHVEEMATRLFIVLAVMAGVAVLTLPSSDELINFLWYSFLDGPANDCARVAVNAQQGGQAAGPAGADCPHVYSPLALILARLKVASLVGLIVALPVFVY